MALQDLKYEMDGGLVALVRMSDAEAAVAGTEPGGNVDLPAHVINSGSRRQFGIHPRSIVAARTVGTAPNTFQKYKTVAVLTTTTFNSAAYAVGEDLTIGGDTFTITRKIPESTV